MAEKRATLILQLKDQASNSIKKLQGGLAALKRNWLAITAAVGGAVAIGASAVRAFIKQENAVEQLNVALKNQGITSQEVSKDLQDYAAELQKITTVGDETIIETEALLTTFGLVGDELKATTKAALDLSTGLGIDLKAATLLLGKAAAGDITTLSRYGIKIAEGTKESEKFAAVLEQVNMRFGGAAQARLNTFSGQMENLSNRVGDLKEKLGAQLIPVLQQWATWADKIVASIERMTAVSQEQMTVDELALQQLMQKRDLLIEDLTNRGVLALMNEEDLNQKQKDLQLTTKLIIQTKKRIAESKRLAKQNLLTTKGTMKQESELLKHRGAIDEQIKKAQAEARNRYIQTEQQKVQVVQSSLGMISSLTTSTNKTLSAVGKAAAISLATINTYRGATLALATIPPPFGFAMAAAVIAAGMAQVANIAGVQLQRGGLVLPREGGVQTIVAEAGKPEAVIPLEDERTKELFGEAGIGGLTININPGVFIGSEENMRNLAKALDDEFFDLISNNESNAFRSLT